jgi:site-specific recombinase XerC
MARRVEPGDAVERYRRWLASVPLAERSKREYARNVERSATGWPRSTLRDGAAIHSPIRSPGITARDFKRFLKVERGLRPASVNLALASLDSLYRCLGLGAPNVRREELPQAAPRALDIDEQRRLLRATERASARDRAIVLTMLFATVRIAELVALNVDDVRATASWSSAPARATRSERCR